MVKLVMSKELFVFSIDSHPLILLLTSCCTFFKASILIQRLFDKLSELGMSASCKKDIKYQTGETSKVDLIEPFSLWTHL